MTLVTITGTGYDREFLGLGIAPPTGVDGDGDLLELPRGGTELTYTHFSVALHRARRLARWVAWNIDGGTRWDGDDIPRSGLRFRLDPRIPAIAQVGDELYRDNPLDRGHLARRADLLWGSRAEAQAANRDSFHFPNITPQMDTFNQSGKDGVWGRLENALLATTGVGRVSVFAGPVFADDDPIYRGVAVPLSYFKVLVYRDGRWQNEQAPTGDLQARAFLLTQTLSGLRTVSPLDEFVTDELILAALTDRTGLRFDPALSAAPADRRTGVVAGGVRRIRELADIEW